MSSRNRHSTAQPNPSRRSIAATPGSSRSAFGSSLPPYKKPSHPLNPTAQIKLRQIYDHRTSLSLKDHNKQAIKCLTEAAESINDQLREREERVARRRKKWEKGERLDVKEVEERELDELQRKVDDMTRRLEESVRGVIDSGEGVQRIEDSLNWIRENAPGQLEQEYATQMNQRQSQSQQRQTQADHDEDDERGEEEGPTPGPTPLSQERVTLTGASELFKDHMERKKNEYLSFSHSARYAKNNDYIGFKSMVHDAKYGDNGPPLPHSDTWFAERGAPAPGVTATQEDAEDEDDIVVDKATVSTRCPITFQQFKEPYTSKKCPHTYEKYAILEMIRRSGLTIGNGGPRGRGEKAVQCPVTGCDQVSKTILRYGHYLGEDVLTCTSRTSRFQISMRTSS